METHDVVESAGFLNGNDEGLKRMKYVGYQSSRWRERVLQAIHWKAGVQCEA